MAYKSRPGGWIVEVNYCKRCHYVEKYCICKKEGKVENNLSEKEQKLLELIEKSNYKVTVQDIEKKLGKEYVGALGKLMNRKLVEGRKERQLVDENKYGARLVKYYVIKEKK